MQRSAVSFSQACRESSDKAWAAFRASFDIEAFHREHCHPNCPWDGKTLFSKGVGIEVLKEAVPV